VYNKNQARTPEHKNLVRKPWSFLSQESCIEGMAKESCLKIKKNKDLEKREAKLSIGVMISSF
jgi:hypothetical protein